MTRLDRACGIAVLILTTVGMRVASNARMTPHRPSDAMLRLAWSARAERIEHCHAQSEEALARLPPHMRQAVVCEGTTAAYRLEVRHGGAVVLDDAVRAGGIRHDRPLYVFREIPVPSGEASVSVRLTRIEPGAAAHGPDRSRAERNASEETVAGPNRDLRRRDSEERNRERAAALPVSLVLEQRLHFRPREVILVTYDAERRALISVASR
jgi:hypothetical protein